MNKSLIDTDILSLFLRNNQKVVSNVNSYLDSYKQISFSILTYYEILSGLKYRDNKNYINRFIAFCEYSEIISFPNCNRTNNYNCIIFLKRSYQVS